MSEASPTPRTPYAFTFATVLDLSEAAPIPATHEARVEQFQSINKLFRRFEEAAAEELKHGDTETRDTLSGLRHRGFRLVRAMTEIDRVLGGVSSFDVTMERRDRIRAGYAAWCDARVAAYAVLQRELETAIATQKPLGEVIRAANRRRRRR